MPPDSRVDEHESRSSHSPGPRTGELQTTPAPRKKRRRRKKRTSEGIPTWRIALAAVLSVLILGATAYRIHSTIEEERLAPIKAAQEREVQLQAYVAEFRAEAQTAQDDPRLDDLEESLSSIMNAEYRFAFNKQYGPRAEAFIDEATQLLSDSASASDALSDIASQMSRLKYDLELDVKDLEQLHTKVSYKTFLVSRQFDTMMSGKAVFEAMDDTYRRCALIAHERDVAPIDGRRIRLAVESLGNAPVVVTRSNGYDHYDVTEYFPTYEVSRKADEMAELEQKVTENRKRLEELNPLYAAANGRLPGLKKRFADLAKRL